VATVCRAKPSGWRSTPNPGSVAGGRDHAPQMTIMTSASSTRDRHTTMPQLDQPPAGSAARLGAVVWPRRPSRGRVPGATGAGLTVSSDERAHSVPGQLQPRRRRAHLHVEVVDLSAGRVAANTRGALPARAPPAQARSLRSGPAPYWFCMRSSLWMRSDFLATSSADRSSVSSSASCFWRSCCGDQRCSDATRLTLRARMSPLQRGGGAVVGNAHVHHQSCRFWVVLLVVAYRDTCVAHSLTGEALLEVHKSLEAEQPGKHGA